MRNRRGGAKKEGEKEDEETLGPFRGFFVYVCTPMGVGGGC